MSLQSHTFWKALPFAHATSVAVTTLPAVGQKGNKRLVSAVRLLNVLPLVTSLYCLDA